MYYFYDLLINFQDADNLYEFYEWEETDDIDFVKKIPLFRITSNTLKDLLKYQVKFERKMLEKIQDKTILKSSYKTLNNTFLVCDSKNALALELDDEGLIINRSKLLLSDEMNLCEMIFTIPITKLSYEKIKKYPKRCEIRKIAKIKKLIKSEIDTLYESKNISKLKYLYFEWFNKQSSDIELIYEKMNENLKHNFDENQMRIYDLIKLTYHKVN
jgi:hypothetical protein